jgi:uncharacterized protein
MTKILLLSDTHAYLDDGMRHYFDQADEIWHAGDFGNLTLAQDIASHKPLRGVYGNIDGNDVRQHYPEINHFCVDGVEVLMMHIGGYPGKYTPVAKREIMAKRPKLFISGHSHILKAMHDSTHNLLHLNPGACGKVGWHQQRTMMRFTLHEGEISDLEIIELAGR